MTKFEIESGAAISAYEAGETLSMGQLELAREGYREKKNTRKVREINELLRNMLMTRFRSMGCK